MIDTIKILRVGIVGTVLPFVIGMVFALLPRDSDTVEICRMGIVGTVPPFVIGVVFALGFISTGGGRLLLLGWRWLSWLGLSC